MDRLFYCEVFNLEYTLCLLTNHYPSALAQGLRYGKYTADDGASK